MEEKPFVFIHVPKTAGTSLRKIIEKNYRPEQLFFVYDKHPGFYSINDMKKLKSEDIKNFKIIMGHFPFNKVFFPAEKMRFVTMVREPIERVISYYHHIMTHNNEWRGKRISLLKYLEISGDLQLQDHQTRVLSGVNHNPVTEVHFEKAIENISNYFDHIGLSERFNETVDYFINLLGWQEKELYYENVSIDRPDATSYSIYELDKIRENNQYDIKLYKYIKNKLLH